MNRKSILFYGLEEEKTKKRKLKKWIDYLLIIINIIAVILLTGENNNILHDLVIKIMLLGIILLNSKILKKYSRILN